MTICKIGITTLSDYYEEVIYGVVDTVERVAEIENCDNVIGIEIMSMETGEILYLQTITERYVSAECPVLLAEEILS